MKVSETPAVMMLAVLADGRDHALAREQCLACSNYLVEFVSSPGLRAAADARLPLRELVCVNVEGPCIAAIKAKKWFKALGEVTKP